MDSRQEQATIHHPLGTIHWLAHALSFPWVKLNLTAVARLLPLPPMNTPWLPNFILSDGTKILGPLDKRPDPAPGPVAELELNGKPFFVIHSGEYLSVAQMAEVKHLVQQKPPSPAP